MSLWGMFRPISSLVYPSHFNAKPDKKFMSMLMGLVDGDGYIEIGPQKQYNKSSVLPKSTIRARLVIRLNNRDRDLLVYITKVLGVGSISSLDSENQTRLIISKKDLSTVIIPLIKSYNLQFLTLSRIKQYSLLSYIIDNNIIHWENVNFKEPSVYASKSAQDLIKLDYFAG